jgi:transposase
MIVIGVDAHKRTHTCAAVQELTGREVETRTAAARDAGHGRLLEWARALGEQVVWAIEDCRHVSGRLERFLLARGERVIRIPPKLMAGARKSAREPGKSDPIDALAVARAAIREGIDSFVTAQLAGDRLLTVACDGRTRDDVGMTLSELADARVNLGATDALNLDGGGSASLSHAGCLRNRPREEHGIDLLDGRAIVTAIIFEPR